MRGDAQDIDIHNDYITCLLNDVTYVGCVVFSGGEPFLNVSAIEAFVSHARAHSVHVDSFFIATNGVLFEPPMTLHTQRAIIAYMELYSLVADIEYSGVRLSADKFHDFNISRNNLLRAFTDVEIERTLSERDLLPEGRAANFTDNGRAAPQSVVNYKYPEELQVYLNAKGKVCWNCDLSYDRQDEVGVSISEAKEVIKKCTDIYYEQYA